MEELATEPVVNDCPFCGGAAEIVYEGWNCGAHIECEECESRTRHIEDDNTSLGNAWIAARLWNVPTAELAKLREASRDSD